eukprot:GHVT01059571.1.p1 GENE.GHVT01059571.1~~GHVT01059571.1.p1  ORF type:complete len:147 (+),score=9.22 GHVT01059571.1:105-545(+)
MAVADIRTRAGQASSIRAESVRLSNRLPESQRIPAATGLLRPCPLASSTVSSSTLSSPNLNSVRGRSSRSAGWPSSTASRACLTASARSAPGASAIPAVSRVLQASSAQAHPRAAEARRYRSRPPSRGPRWPGAGELPRSCRSTSA